MNGAFLAMLLISVPLSGCSYVFGESESAIDLFNPTTQEHVLCGYSRQVTASVSDIAEQHRCMEAYEAKGFHVVGAID